MTPLLVVLLLFCAEAYREAFHPDLSFDRPRGWAAKHYQRMRPVVPPAVVRDPEFTWWAHRKTTKEKLEHRRHWHIDLLGRRK